MRITAFAMQLVNSYSQSIHCCALPAFQHRLRRPCSPSCRRCRKTAPPPLPRSNPPSPPGVKNFHGLSSIFTSTTSPRTYVGPGLVLTDSQKFYNLFQAIFAASRNDLRHRRHTGNERNFFSQTMLVNSNSPSGRRYNNCIIICWESTNFHSKGKCHDFSLTFCHMIAAFGLNTLFIN